MPYNIAGKYIPPGNGGVTYPSPNEWTVTCHAITGITNAGQAVVTAVAHGITISSAAYASIPKVDFTQVKGMKEINGKFAFVVEVIDEDNVKVDLDTTRFTAYSSGGFLNVTAGASPIDPLTNVA